MGVRVGAVILHVIAFAFYTALLIYSSIELGNETTLYPLSRDVLEVNPATGYIEAVAIHVNASNLNVVEIAIAIAALGVAFHIAFIISYAVSANWIENAHSSGMNSIRWIEATAMLSMVTILTVNRLGIVDEYLGMTLFGLVGTSQLFNMVAEIVASRPTAGKGYKRVQRGRGTTNNRKAAIAVISAISSLFPLLVGFIVVYMRFVDVDKGQLQKHVYMYAVVPFAVLILNVLWTILFAVNVLKPGTLYEAGHVFALIFIVVPVLFTIVYFSN